MRHREPSGFTVIELAFTVAIIAILAAIAQPSFFGISTKAKAAAEVGNVFSDLRTRLDQYQVENADYGTNQTEAGMWPGGVPSSTARTVFPLPAAWLDLKVVLSNETDLYCQYTWVTGPGNNGPTNNVIDNTVNVGPIATAQFTYVPPSTIWYYLLARCNLDNDVSVDGYYFSDSVNTTIRSTNPGR